MRKGIVIWAVILTLVLVAGMFSVNTVSAAGAEDVQQNLTTIENESSRVMLAAGWPSVKSTSVSVTHKHTWDIVDCGEATYCKECGIYGGRARYPRHEYENKFLRVFDRCTKCGRMQIENSDFDWVARLAEVFGVLLVAFGFQYAIRKRKFMRINWLIVIFLWLEENTFFGNLTPALLWRKKLD